MKYRKKPIVIEARQVTKADCRSISEWIGYPHIDGDSECGISGISIPTLEGLATANPGDWVIKGLQGEFYSCKPDIFEQTYEPVS